MIREDPRRAFLLKVLGAGLLALAPVPNAFAQAFGQRPRRLDRSVYEIVGDVRVNGQPATQQTRIVPGDRIETGTASRAIFVIGPDAYVLRANSRLETTGQAVAGVMRLVTGALLSVFGKGDARNIHIHTATIGIRGTGLYLESDPEQGYVCNCYGDMTITAADDRSVSERVVTRHHDAPRYVVRAGAAQRIRPAPFINHSDLELMLIEVLTGRVTPFPLFDEDYGGARRRY